jgi:tRNA(Ile)-lysidine synthase
MWLGTVRRTVQERGLIRPGAPVLLALSGGPDSAGLALALGTLRPELGITLHVASIDHGLRPESAAEVELARRHAAAIGASFASVRLALPAGADLAARARQARYAALFELARDVHAEHVAVGHTRDDQAETVLARLLRGASVRGLRGIQPARGDGVIRPLLDCRRSDVHRAVAEAGWEVARDPTNEDLTHQRARLRAEVLPRLTREDPRLVDHLAELADDAAGLLELLEAMASGVVAAAQDEPGRLRSEPFRRAPQACRREALAQALREHTGSRPSRVQLLEVERLLRGRGEVPLSGGWLARAEPGWLLLERSTEALPSREPARGEEG